jgi:type IV pilus assembly protein PilB
LILREALALRATEIRIEPRVENIRVWYRINGAWVERDNPPRRLLAAIVARVIHMAAADDSWNGRRRRGRLRGNFDGVPFDLGVRIRETAHGPYVVITV